MSSIGKRVFWNDAEKSLLAEHMAALLQEKPTLSMLQAVREAQTQLPEDRRREIVTWSIVAGALQPLLLAAQESLESKQAGQQSAGAARPREPAEPLPQGVAPALSPAPGEPAQSLQPLPAPSEVAHPHPLSAHIPPAESAQPSARAAEVAEAALALPSTRVAEGSGRTWDPLQVEAALLAALTSPVVERALVDLFGRAMSQAFSRLSPGNAREETPALREPMSGEGRVLLAGFAATDAMLLSSALADHFEVRTWKPLQSAQLFETLARMCPVVVVPEEMSEEVDDLVNSLGSRLVRFQGSASRALERVQAAMAA